MKKYNWLISPAIIILLWFSLAFACNNGKDRGRTTSYDTTPARQTRQNTNDELTEQIVRDYFTNSYMKDCNELYECKVVFETSIQIGSPVRRNIDGGLPPPEGGLALAYPVKVDISYYSRNKDLEGGIGQWKRQRGGIHYFYRDVNYVWNDAPSGADLTFENEER